MSELLLREPPYSVEAEHSVLGALLMDPSAFDRIDWLEADHFYSDAHRRIFRAQRKLIEANRGADVVLVGEELKEAGDLERAGGYAFLASLASNTPSSYNIARYAEIVRDKAILRALLTHATEIQDRAMSPQVSPQELAEHAEAAFLSVLQPSQGDEPMTMLQAVDQALEWIDNPQQGLSTGYAQVDNIIGGLRPEELIIVAGRPSMGKSALVACIVEHVAKSSPVLFCSLEMSARQIAARSLTYHRAKLGTLDATRHLAGLKLHIDPRSPLSLSSLRLRARRHKRRHGLGLLVVDYLQLMTGPKSDNRHQEIGAISRGLKGIAKEFGIPVIAVASLNRQTEGRNDKRPMLSDLKESGDIESDADIVAMVYRDEVYSQASEWQGIAEIIVRKHREGPIGTAYLGWRGEETRFSEWHPPIPTATVTPMKASKSAPPFDFKTAASGEREGGE